MKIHKRFNCNSKIPADLKVGDVIPYSASVMGSDLINKLNLHGYNAVCFNWGDKFPTKCLVKAFGFVEITALNNIDRYEN